MASSGSTNVTPNGTVKGEPSLREVSIQLEALKADLANLTEAMGDYGKARYRSTREEARARARSAQAAAEDGYDFLQGEAERYAREAQTLVREQPGAAVGFAAALGFLVGLVVSRR